MQKEWISYHFQTLTLSSTDPVTMFSDPSFSLRAHEQLQILSSCASNDKYSLISEEFWSQSPWKESEEEWKMYVYNMMQ